MKLRILILMAIAIVLFSCESVKDIKDNNINIYFFKAVTNENFIKYQPQIRKVINKSIEQCQSYFEVKNLDIVVRHRYYDPGIVPELGIGGSYIDTHTIQILLNMAFKDLDQLINVNLNRLMLHELGHLVHHDAVGVDGKLLSYIVSEGLADHFEMKISGSDPQAWSVNLSPEQLVEYWELAKEENKKEVFNYNKWYFGTTEFPRWVVYSLGYEVVEKYLKHYPEKEIFDIMQKPAVNIISLL